MLILLPPSEGKTAPQSGPPVDLAALSHPELAKQRQRVGNALVTASGRRNALAVLGAGPSLADEVARNIALWTNPAAPSASVYTGVLYDAAGASSWTAVELANAKDRVRIISGLWGAVSPTDPIPAYRLSMGTSLPRLGRLASFWRAHLGAALDPLAVDKLVIDCRSSDYGSAWRAPKGTLAVRVEEIRGGKRQVVSHSAKYTRGLLAGALVRAATAPADADALAHAATALPNVASVELTETALVLITA